MILRTKLHGKNTIHEYNHEFTNMGESIRLFEPIRGRYITNPTMNLSSFIVSTSLNASLPNSSFILW